MFTAIAHKNLTDAEKYFDEHLAQNDYYAAGEIRPGQWIGVGAEHLGLKVEVTRDQFHALCENQNPETGERLTQRLVHVHHRLRRITQRRSRRCNGRCPQRETSRR